MARPRPASNRHHRACPGDPRLFFCAAVRKTRMPGIKPGMTVTFCEEKSAWTPSFLLLLIHREHALGDQEAAENVHGCKDQRDEAERPGPQGALVIGNKRDTDRKQRAND